MGRHARPGPPDQPPRLTPGDPLTLYYLRRRAPENVYHRHRPAGGGGVHVRPQEPRILDSWDGFRYLPIGIAPDLDAARTWARTLSERTSTA
ncbi:DUF6087 family protein [Streptomyces sp. CAU 1734]